MKNFKNNLTNENINSNRKLQYKAISLASLSTLALTLTLGDANIANAMMTKTGTVKFYGSNGTRVITGSHNKLPSTSGGPLKVTGDIAGRFNNTTGGFGTSSNLSKPNTPFGSKPTVKPGTSFGSSNSIKPNTSIGSSNTTKPSSSSNGKTYTSTLHIQLGGNSKSPLGSGSSTTKKPTTTGTSSSTGTTSLNKQPSSSSNNTTSPSINTNKKPITTTTNQSNSSQPVLEHASDGTPYISKNGEKYIYLKDGSKINLDIDGNGNPVYYTKDASGKVTYLQKVGHDDDPKFTPTKNNKPVSSIGTQTNSSLTSKKDPKPSTSTQIDPDGDGNKTLVSKKPTNNTNQINNKDDLYNATLVTLDDDGNIIQQNNSGSTTIQTNTGTSTGNKKLTKKQKIALGVAGGTAGLATILGLSLGLTANGNNDNKNSNKDNPPNLVPIPKVPAHSISVVNSPEGNLFIDN